MSFSNTTTKNSTAAIRAVCAIVFCLFSFVYLYYYQADMVAVAQHILSDGTRHYDRTIGGILITFALQALQVGVFAFCRLDRKFHALTYFPSLLILAVMTDVSPNIDKEFSFGAWLWVFPLILVGWGGTVIVLRNYQQYENPSPSGLFSCNMWINMMMMATMLFLVGIVSNGNSVFHYRMYAERCLLAGDSERVLDIGRKSLETDNNLTMLRIYALAREGRLGDALFTYPVAGTSDDIIPQEDGAHCIIYPNDSIYRYLGAKPSGKVKAIKFLKTLVNLGMATDAVKDYILCGYLIDKNLDGFAHMLPRFYEVSDSLPKHYREALTLYTHLRSNPYIIYHNSVMDTDFEDLQTLEKQYTVPSARKIAIHKQYSGTYWWYYDYGND